MDGFQVNQFPVNIPLVQNWQQIPNNVQGNALPAQSFQENLEKAQQEKFSSYDETRETNFPSSQPYQEQYNYQYPESDSDYNIEEKNNSSPHNNGRNYINYTPSPVYSTNQDTIQDYQANSYTQSEEYPKNIKAAQQNNFSSDYNSDYNNSTAVTDLEPKQIQQSIPAVIKKDNIANNSFNNSVQTNDNPGIIEQIRMYKEDQLMANPGGDYYTENENGQIQYNPNFDNSNFANRVGKDISDSASNIKNAVANLAAGAKYSYIDSEGKIQTAQKTGLLKTMGNFAKHFFDAITFGSFNKETPQNQNIIQKAGYSAKKLLVDGVVKDVLIGIPHSMINAGENVLLATMNAMEVVPDATIGNMKAGEKITTSLFDNGQVAVNYISDIMPTGEAWMRVNAPGSTDSGLKLPILYNLKTPQQGLEDMRWASVRNTPFRKAIETVGSLLSQIVTMAAP